MTAGPVANPAPGRYTETHPIIRREAAMQSRLLSKVTWIAVSAQVVSLLVILGVMDTGAGDAVNALVVALCECLTAFGVLNNPTYKNNF